MMEHRGEPHATVALGYQVESREARFEPDVARSTLQKPKSTILEGSGDSFDGNVGLGGGGSRRLATGDCGSTVSPDAVPDVLP
jgi:hypothetical protein